MRRATVNFSWAIPPGRRTKEVSRIESLLCVYFMALLIQALLERELRGSMAVSKIESLPFYPEGRACRRPTTRRVIDVMEHEPASLEHPRSLRTRFVHRSNPTPSSCH